MGGELWHQKFAARSKMLAYALDFEERVVAGGLDSAENRCVLALFSDGFAWHEDELEDFVSFYRTGRHRGDDGLAKMEQGELVALTDAFVHEATAQASWKAFARRSQVPFESLEQVVAELRAFLRVPLEGARSGAEFTARWLPGGPWT